MKIFISWSGSRSNRMAHCLARWLPRVIQNCRTWLSDRDIEKGRRWFEEIGKTLEGHNFGIICTTPENSNAPWLLFEAGALSKSIGRARVCPLLLGMRPNDLEGPLQQFQATVVDKDDILKLVTTINGQMGDARLEREVLSDCFERFWTDLEGEMKTIAAIPIPGGEFAISPVVEAFAKHGLPPPVIGSEARFTSGYESHGLYSTVMEVAQRRLYIMGRKNRKVFDKEHQDFFAAMKQKIACGLDFRFLFLDPESPVHIIRAAHKDSDFPAQLESSIQAAIRLLERYGIEPRSVCRKYSILRTASVVISAITRSPRPTSGLACISGATGRTSTGNGWSSSSVFCCGDLLPYPTDTQGKSAVIPLARIRAVGGQAPQNRFLPRPISCHWALWNRQKQQCLEVVVTDMNLPAEAINRRRRSPRMRILWGPLGRPRHLDLGVGAIRIAIPSLFLRYVELGKPFLVETVVLERRIDGARKKQEISCTSSSRNWRTASGSKRRRTSRPPTAGL